MSPGRIWSMSDAKSPRSDSRASRMWRTDPTLRMTVATPAQARARTPTFPLGAGSGRSTASATNVASRTLSIDAAPTWNGSATTSAMQSASGACKRSRSRRRSRRTASRWLATTSRMPVHHTNPAKSSNFAGHGSWIQSGTAFTARHSDM